MSNSKDFYNAVTDFRNALREINSRYDAKVEALEQFKGSRGYEANKKELEEQRQTEIEQLRWRTSRRLDSCLQSMREAVTNRKLTPPTQEQLAILAALKMRDKLSMDELKQAAKAVGDNPVCVGVLNDLARANEYMGASFGTTLPTDEALRGVTTMTENASKLLRLTRPDTRREHIAPGGDFQLFRIDRDFSSADECVAWYSGTMNGEAFVKAVDGV